MREGRQGSEAVLTGVTDVQEILSPRGVFNNWAKWHSVACFVSLRMVTGHASCTSYLSYGSAAPRQVVIPFTGQAILSPHGVFKKWVNTDCVAGFVQLRMANGHVQCTSYLSNGNAAPGQVVKGLMPLTLWQRRACYTETVSTGCS
ncbi:hypothetical protein HPB50_000079 [Hyalomma asiaticum]|uniref:Uncharacterized protein n=1 Tax=Hyalomma asiaticum TaxID=266040 RepID=A0ACB7SZ15_HYAAI|nr:hypothetical protein HPB50_000079 [Hyalomma asiaticum]